MGFLVKRRGLAGGAAGYEREAERDATAGVPGLHDAFIGEGWPPADGWEPAAVELAWRRGKSKINKLNQQHTKNPVTSQ